MGKPESTFPHQDETPVPEEAMGGNGLFGMYVREAGQAYGQTFFFNRHAAGTPYAMQ